MIFDMENSDRIINNAIACCSIDILVWLVRECFDLNPAATIALYTVETDVLHCLAMSRIG